MNRKKGSQKQLGQHCHCLAATKISRYVKGTNALFMERASQSSKPFGIEEAAPFKKGKTNKLDMTELVIDLFDCVVSANLEDKRPKSVPVLATNFEVEDIERLIY